MDPLRSFADVLAAAIDDILEHGFDSLERIERWKRELRDAAERQAGDPLVMEQKLREAFAAIYSKQVDNLEILRHQSGEVPRFTLEKVKPQLRDELDRRIQASANLIKLNRQEAISKTLHRFEGWSTSIPPGGVSGEKRKDVRNNQLKALRSLPFEERRVLIDQGHKLVSSLQEILASDGGAIAVIWHSHWRQAGYDYRPDHKDRDGKIYLIRDSWAHQAGLVKRGAVGYYDEVTAFAQEPSCRCYGTWIYNLRDLPVDMLTVKGKAKLEEARNQIAAMSARRARADAIDVENIPVPSAIMQRVAEADQMDFLRGVHSIRIVPDMDQWHGQEDAGTIELEAKFLGMSMVEQSQVLMHEVGHAGQDVDPTTWAEFCRLHDGRLSAFAQMANRAHLEDFERRGDPEGGIASEVFAESYARFCLGLALPQFLKDFWLSRVTGRISPADAKYMAWWPNKQTRCIRCSMFETGLDPRHNSCSAVAGDIAMHGHCRLFQISAARADGAEPDPVPLIGYAAVRRRLDRLEREAAKLRTGSDN